MIGIEAIIVHPLKALGVTQMSIHSLTVNLTHEALKPIEAVVGIILLTEPLQVLELGHVMAQPV